MIAWPVSPMTAVSGELPADDGWAFEVKWDGHRLIAFVAPSGVRTHSRIGRERVVPELAGLRESVGGHRVVLDGELVALDESGRPSFGALQRGEGALAYVAFDLLSLDGRDIVGEPYEDRRARLLDTVRPGDHWLVPAHHVGGGAELLEAAGARGLEGIMAKRLGSPYLPGKRSPAWRKVKLRKRQELVIGGLTRGEGNRSGSFGAVLVGYHEGGHLRYAGSVGSGFDQRTLDRVLALAASRRRERSPFDPPPPAAVARGATWLEPDLVCEVTFTEWTREALLRQPVFLGLRDDKDAAEVVREP